MAIHADQGKIWDVEYALRRMEDRHFERYRETYHRVGVIANSLAGMTFSSLYRDPLSVTIARIRENVQRPEMVSEKLLTLVEQQACVQGLLAIEDVLLGQPAGLNIYALATEPAGQFPDLLPLFERLNASSKQICIPFVQPGYDPATAKTHLDAFLSLVGDNRTYIELYDRPAAWGWRADFNRVMVGAKRAGLLVELRGICRPAASCYVSDPTDERWDIRSCVPPENAVLFKDVHLKINTMGYLMWGLNYGDFFDLPMIDPKVLPHIKNRVLADKDYWFTPLQKERVSAALDAILTFLTGSAEYEGLTLREVYGNPDVPSEVLIQFRRMLDVKPELCIPFLDHAWDYAEASDAIDIFLTRAREYSLKELYTGALGKPKTKYTQSEYELLLKQRTATKTLLGKSNNLYCDAPGECIYLYDEYCNTTPITGNCQPL